MAEQKMTIKDLNGQQKVAILMITLGVEVSSQIFKIMNKEDIEEVTLEIARTENVPMHISEKVVEEFYQMVLASEYISIGGLDYAREILEKALGVDKALEVISNVQSSMQVTGFSVLRKIDPHLLSMSLNKEHPQTIALILAYLDTNQTAQVLSELSPEMQQDVAYRIATMGKISPDLLTEIERVMKGLAESVATSDMSVVGGAKSLAEILNKCNRNTERNILEDLERRNPELASDVKNLMFVFEDIVGIDDRSIQTLLKEVETKELTLALKVASDELKSKFFTNLSERAAQIIEEELEYMGPVKLRDVEEAQLKIVETVRALEEDGQIVLGGRGAEDELVV